MKPFRTEVRVMRLFIRLKSERRTKGFDYLLVKKSE